MSFFASFFLWGLALTSIPILIALWNQKRRRQEKFGAFYLLRKIAETTTRRIRLLEILKLLNRILLVSLLIMIFAEPYRIVTRIGEAEAGFVVLLDVGRAMQSETKEGVILPDLQISQTKKLLESLPSQVQGLVGFVSSRCEWASPGDARQTARPSEWIDLLSKNQIPYVNLQTDTSALQSCLSKADAVFSGKNIFKAFISPLPDTLSENILENTDLHIERLPSPSLPKEEKVEVHQETQDASVRITLAAGGAQTASLIQENRVEPLGRLESTIDLPNRENSTLMLVGEETSDPWVHRNLFPLQSQNSRTVSIWSLKETPGFLSLVSALRNHPQIRVQKQIGGQPQGDAVIIYGSYPYPSEGLQRAFFFVDPQGQTPFPVRDKKTLSSSFSSADLIRAFQFETPQGVVTIRRYVLLDPDRFETLSSFQDGAPSLLRDRSAESRHWIAPFDLEDLTTDLALEAAFIPYLYTQLESWLQNMQTVGGDQEYQAIYLYPGRSTPLPSVVSKLEWPGLYSSKGQLKVKKPLPLPTGFLKDKENAALLSTREEKSSMREGILKAITVSVILELLLCLLTVPRLLAWILPLLLLALPVQALSVRPISLATWKGMDADRKTALAQIAKESDRLSNLDFAAPADVQPSEFWKYAVVFMSSSSALPTLSREDRQSIRDYAERGGLIVFDDPLATTDSKFYQSVKSEFAQIFPQRDFKSVSKEDVIFRSFYLLNEVSGRKLSSPSIEGIQFDNRWVVLFSFNDLLGANFKKSTGDFGYSVTPYGISQRVLAQRLIVNFLMYSATIDYKDDAIHLPHILKRRVR